MRGGALYLSKPLNGDELENALRLLLRERIVRPSTVLLVDQDAQNRELMTACIEAVGSRAMALTDPRLLFQYLGDLEPDAVVLQGFLPWVSGFDACRAIRAAPRWQDLPVILVTRGGDAELRAAAFQAGADDHLDLDEVAQELAPRLRTRIDRARGARERSDRDSLTGLLLRGAFLDALHRRTMEAERNKGSVAIAILDVDDFKLVNDRHGHPAGDRTLATLARALRGTLRASTIIGRWGGDELVVALPGEGPAAARVAINRALSEFAELRFSGAGGDIFQVTVSVGVAIYPDDGSGADVVLSAADERLYEAKRRRRTQVDPPQAP